MIKNLKYTASAMTLAVTLSLTGCGKNIENIKSLETIEPLETENTTKNLRTEEELRNEIYDLEKELREIQEANHKENFEIVHTLSNLPGVDIANYDNGQIFQMQVIKKQTEKDFITILNCLKSNTCYDLQNLTIKNCDLTKYSEETRNLFKEVMLNLSTVELYNLVLVNINITDISFLSNQNFQNSLYCLDLSHNNISNINALLNLHKLEAVFLENNNISNISALLNLPKLKTVFLENNNISDFSIAEKMKNEGVSVMNIYNQNNFKIEDENDTHLKLGKEYEFNIGDDININIGNNKIKVKTEDGKVKVKVR